MQTAVLGQHKSGDGLKEGSRVQIQETRLKPVRVLLSTGLGRLHFPPAAHALVARGVDLTVITGWMAWGIVPRLLRRMFGDVWADRIGARRAAWTGVRVRTCGSAEMAAQVLLFLVRRLRGPVSRIEGLGWRWFGRSSVRYLNDASVFHVRSGAGQGGAIQEARKNGMRIVVDHSIAHPQFLATRLGGAFAEEGGLWRGVERDCLDADIVLVNSEFVRQTFVDAGFSAGKLRVVYLGVEAMFRDVALRSDRADVADRSTLRLLFVGGFCARKGADCLLVAMDLLAGRGWKGTLDVVGDLLFDTEAWRKREDIRFHGRVKHEQIVAFLKRTDVFVFPTLAEGCAKAVMEAMAAGVCVVTTRESGAPVVDGTTGFLVAAGDAKALADKLEWLAEHRDVVGKVGEAAAVALSGYTWERYAEKVESLYQELAGCSR